MQRWREVVLRVRARAASASHAPPSVVNEVRLRHAWKAALLVLFLAFAAVKVTAFWGEGPLHTGDERVWAMVAGNSIFTLDFWVSIRPFTVPLLHKVCALDEPCVVWVQCAIATLSWGVFALALARLVSSPLLALLAFASVLALALASPVHSWDFVVRSESASMSFLMLTFACVLLFLQEVARGSVKGAWIAGFSSVGAALFAVFSRDTNSYILLLLAPWVLLGTWLVRTRSRKDAQEHVAPRTQLATTETSRFRRLTRQPLLQGAALAGVLILLALTSQANMKKAERYRGPLMNVIFQRVLPKSHRLRYFRDELGMPVSKALHSRKRKWHSSNRWFAFRSPELEDFRVWLKDKGYAGYQRYLLAHLPQTFREAEVEFPKLVRNLNRKQLRRGKHDGSEWLDESYSDMGSRFDPFTVLLGVLAAGCVGLGMKRKELRIFGGFALFLLLATVSQTYISYHGDAMEVARHAMIVPLLFRLAVLVAGLLILASVWIGLKWGARVFLARRAQRRVSV